MSDLDQLLAEQVAYYRARAGEFDLAYQHREDLRSLDELAMGLPVVGDVLELACGTGQWTAFLAARGHRVMAVDAAPEMLDRARRRVVEPGVEFVQADVFRWQVPRRFDTVFFAFWLSHVPPARFAEFWSFVGDALAPGGRACFIDSGPGDEAGEELLAGQPAPAVRRRLTDGSVHRVVKVFPHPDRLVRELERIGWSASVWLTGSKLTAGFAAPERVSPRLDAPP